MYRDYEKTGRSHRAYFKKRCTISKEKWEARHKDRERTISLRKYRKGREADRLHAVLPDDYGKT